MNMKRWLGPIVAAAMLVASGASHAQGTPRPWSTSIWNSPDVVTVTGGMRIGVATGVGQERYMTPAELATFIGGGGGAGVSSFNTRTGVITLSATDIGGAITATAPSHQFFNTLSALGVFGSAQVGVGDLQGIPASTVVGNISGVTGIPTALNSTQLTTLISPFTASLSGAVAPSGGGTANFLRADGVWATPGGGGNVTGPVSSINNHVTTFNGVSGTNIQDSGIAIGSLLTANQTITLSGDASGSGATSIAVTNGKVNSVTFPAGPSLHSTPIVTAANTVSYKPVTDCPDTAGQHTNYNQSTDTWSCGITSSTAGVGSVTGGSSGIVCTPTTGSVVCSTTTPVRAQATTTDTVLSSDGGKLVNESNSAGVAVALPTVATSGFGAGFGTTILNGNASGQVTVTSASNINGAGSIALNPFQAAFVQSDGATYEAVIVNTESGSDSLTAHAGGGQASALQLSSTINNITTVATTADSVKLPKSFGGERIIVTNSGANSMQVFGTSPDTVNGVATGTGVSQANTITTIYVSPAAGKWLSTALSAGAGGASLSANNTWTKAQAVSPFALTDGASIAVDATQSNSFTVTLAGNRALANPTGVIAGQFMEFSFLQDATGTRTLTYGTNFKFPGGAAPTLTTAANAEDDLSCWARTTTILVCQMLSNVH